ncbi:MAG TPA: protein kinase [Gemmatimonadaceae bacterium]|jgi:serine/threonine-protein kinase|nr:protein kinase [Gemmatimonadaceae bacterium]
MSDSAASLTSALDGRYAIVRELGSGGMATVYLAEDLKHQRQVAVKVLRPDLAAVIGAERFLTEIRTTARLQHPHILPLFDSGEADGFLFYVMPYVEGESLRQRLDRETQLPLDDVVRIATEVAGGLDYAHRQGVIHRDIKPENILLHEGSALIADFGIALAASKAGGSTRMTETGMSLGTPHYMSPEQAMGQREITSCSDVYALGAVTYEMLVGEPPFTGPTAQAIVAKVITTEPLAPRVQRRTIPQGMNDAVLIALAKVPADRFKSTLQFAEALRRSDTGSVRNVRSGSTRASSRRRMIVAAVVLLAAVALAVAAHSRVVANRRLVVRGTHAVTSEAGLYLDPALSPDGRFLAYAAGPSSRMHIYVRSLDGGRAIPLTDSMPGRQRWPRWSPDGSRIAFMAPGVGISIVPALGGAARLIVPDQGDRRQMRGSPAWSPDGTRIAYSEGPRIRARELDTGRDTVIADLSTLNRFGGGFQLAWSPDGKWIAASVGQSRFAFGGADLGSISPASLVVANVATGRVVPVSADRLEVTMDLSPVWTSDSRHLLFVSTREGGRDVYEIALSSTMEPLGPPWRMTTGLSAFSIALSRDDRTLAYSTYQPVSNLWSIPISETEQTAMSSGREITHSTDLIEEVSASPDGASLVYTSTRSGSSDLYRMPSQGGSAVQLTSDSTNEFSPVWSPDGKEIAFHAIRDGRFHVMITPADGGAAQDVVESSPRGEDWSPDGKLVIAGDPGRRMRSQTPPSATPRTSTPSAPQMPPQEPLQVVARGASGWSAPAPIPGSEGGMLPRWSPDGRFIAFVTPGNPPTLSVIAPTGGVSRVVVRAGEPAGTPVPQQPMWSRDSRTIFFTAIDAEGIGAIWSVPVDGGAPRLRVRFANPDVQMGSSNGRFGVDAKNFYVRLIRHAGTIGTADLATQ